jgi:hypothetical protein
MKKGRLPPRVVLVTRQLPYERLVVEHGTPQQAEFFLRSRGQELAPLQQQAQVFEVVRQLVRRQVPGKWRFVDVRRELLDRFLFEPEDVVVALGQDGLVANVAKYLAGQPVIGVNPDPGRYDGVLVRNSPDAVADLLASAVTGKARTERRTMARASLDDGQHLIALNEVFIGHRTHQSARYRITFGDQVERHSSSGVIVATGTGATGWARSIARERGQQLDLPTIDAAALAFFAREAFPSRTTGTELTAGLVEAPAVLRVESEIELGGVVFGDGIEEDFLRFDFGRRLEVAVADRRLELVVGC